MWNIAHNLGGFAAPIIVGFAARTYGWRWGMWAPGAIGLVMGFLILAFVRDGPTSVGYPPVEPAPEPKVGRGRNEVDGWPRGLAGMTDR
jgi:MFS transporter, OPA family, sugar phosphate sensor protein UhpC